MTAGAYDLIIRQGSTFRCAVIVKNDGVAVDLTGYEARAQVRKAYGSSSPLVEITTTITDPGNGVITLGITAEDTAALPVCNAVWDLEIDDQGGTPEVDPILEGKVEIRPEVTKPVAP